MADLDLLHPTVAAAVAAHELDVEVLPCEEDLADTEAFCAHYGIALEDSANTILVAGQRTETPLVACVVLAVDRLDVNRAVRKRMGAKKASFASLDMATERSGMAHGGVTVVGLPDEIPVWVDADVMERERVVLGGGNRTSKLRMAPDELHRLGVEVAELSRPRD